MQILNHILCLKDFKPNKRIITIMHNNVFNVNVKRFTFSCMSVVLWFVILIMLINIEYVKADEEQQPLECLICEDVMTYIHLRYPCSGNFDQYLYFGELKRPMMDACSNPLTVARPGT